MCNNTFNIKVVEGNAFPLIVRLQALSYEAVPPIAEPIDYTRLTDCVLKVGGVEYEVEITEDGVRAIMPATLALGDYNVVFTAKYESSDIRAAYLRAITIVKWNEQSNAGECLLGSPVVLPAAIVIGGTLTDAELDELKEEMREKNAQLAQAIEDAEAAKAEWERKAAELDDVARETTLVQGVEDIREDIAGINTSDLAKQGTNPNATMSEVQSLLQEIKGAHIINNVSLSGYVTVYPNNPTTVGELLSMYAGLISVVDNETVYTTWMDGSREDSSFPNNLAKLTYIRMNSVETIPSLYNDTSLKEAYFPSAVNTISSLAAPNLQILDISRAYQNNHSPVGYPVSLRSCTKLIDLIWGINAALNGGYIQAWNPTEALNTTQSLLTPEDIAAGFTTNKEKLLYNIREHIAALLPDRTGDTSLTITVSANIKAAINGDTATANAFANKNWIIA